ncbi:cation diffusion facilitator family transporter [Deltaproteobacteria bacterium TL4]
MKYNHCHPCVQEAARLDMIVALFQGVFKLVIAFVTGSVALSASGFFSLADFLTKIITMVSVKVASLPPNERFPYGYGKIEFLSSILIGFLLVLGAFFFLLRQFLTAATPRVTPEWIALIAVLLSAVLADMMSRHLHCAGTENNSTAILAAAWDNRMDSLSSVAVFIGISLTYFGWESADYWAASIISVMIIYVGGRIFYDAFRSLMDTSIPEKITSEIMRMARRTTGVVKVEYCRSRSLGDTWELSLQLAVDDQLSVYEIHQLVKTLRHRIYELHKNFAFIQISHTPVKKTEDPEDSHLLKKFREKTQT